MLAKAIQIIFKSSFIVILLMNCNLDHAQAEETKTIKNVPKIVAHKTQNNQPLKALIYKASKTTPKRKNEYEDLPYVKGAPDWFQHLHSQIVNRVSESKDYMNDHFMTEKWLVDNINDLHRELKQTETDIEHYVKVTKGVIDQNERQLRQQLAIIYQSPQAPFLYHSNFYPDQLRDLYLMMQTLFSYQGR